MTVRRYAPIEYDEMPGAMVTAADYDILTQELKETIEAANGWEGRLMRLFQILDRIRSVVEQTDRRGISDNVCGLLDWIVRSADDAIGPSQQQDFEARCPECGRRQISGSDHFGNCSHAKKVQPSG